MSLNISFLFTLTIQARVFWAGALCVCGSRMIYMRPQRPIITLCNQCPKFNMGDKGKSGPNQRLCYLLSAYNVDYETAQWSDKHMGREQGKNICTPADHTVAGKTLSYCQSLKKKRKLTEQENLVFAWEFPANLLVMTCLTTGWRNSPQLTLGTNCVWVEERSVLLFQFKGGCWRLG